ncbi:MAG: hypothetical protein PHI85_02200 [Victivallaceae bacterium]|nr:hypothetical protein [Victivallaceae bacterium]
MLRHITAAAFCAAGMFFAAGCNGSAKFTCDNLTAGTAVRLQPSENAPTVTVTPFTDMRPYERSGSSLLGMIPLRPYGYAEAGQPENSETFYSISHYDFDAVNDLTAAAAESLRSSNLFSRVEQCKAAGSDTDYVFSATIVACSYKARWFTYCVTYIGAAPFWAIGCPTGSSTVHLRLRFELSERTTGKVLWAQEFDESDYLNHWLYCRYQADMDLLPALMRRAMNLAIIDLKSTGVVSEDALNEARRHSGW